MSTLDQKEHLHELIDRLSVDQIPTVLRFIEFNLLDPVSRSPATAPIDDEPLTEEEARALDASKEWFRHNKGIPHEEVLAEFGLTEADFEQMGEDQARRRG